MPKAKEKPKAAVPRFKDREAMEAVTRQLTPGRGVRECDFLRQRYWNFHRSDALVQADLDALIDTLNAKKIPFVLTGAHGFAAWTGRPRATYDVDLLVKAGRNHARAVKAIRELYPNLDVAVLPGVTGFFLPGDDRSIIDVCLPHRRDLEEALRLTVEVSERGRTYRVPKLEVALANKYGAMVAISRPLRKRGLDIADFVGMVENALQPDRTPIDMEELARLGELVWPGEGGEEILRLVEDVKAGRMPNVETRQE